MAEMTMNEELHPRHDVAWSHVSRKNGGRGITGCGNSVKSEENELGWYVKNNLEPLLVAVRTRRTKANEETVDPKQFKKTKDKQRKKMNGLQKECINNLLEIQRTRIQTAHGDG